MKYIVGVLLFSILFSNNIRAQKTNRLTQTIRGTVTDKSSGQPLPAATVEITNILRNTITDEEGKFILDSVPIGRHTIYTSDKGYEPTIIKEVVVNSAKEVSLEIELTEEGTVLDEIVIHPKFNKEQSLNEMSLLGVQMFSVEEAGRFAGGMDDPARLASNYAGVSTVGTTQNGISIRGNAPSLLQWRLEGIEIPNPNHFADVEGLGGGFLSALSSNVLGNSDFYTGAPPAEYQNAVSGIFDMRLRNGNIQKHQHTFQLGILGIDYATEGPISKELNSSYIINYRYSTTGLLEKIRRNKDMGGTLGYQDLNFKLNFPTHKIGIFSLWGVELSDEVNPTLDLPSEQKYLDDGLLSSAKQKSGATGVSHHYTFGNYKTTIKTTVAGTHMSNHIDEEFYDLQENKTPKTNLTNNNTHLVLTSAIKHKFNPNFSTKTGVTLTHIQYDMDLDFSEFFGQPLENVGQAKENTNLIAGYTQALIRLNNEISLTTGLNMQHLSLNGKTVMEPRASLKWQTAPKSSLAIGYGLHSRMEQPDVYFVKDSEGNFPNKALGFTKSHHFLLFYAYKFSENLNLKIEPYFQSLYNVPVSETGSYSILNRKDFYITQGLVNKGKGQNYGIDLTLSKYMEKGMYYMLTASLFESTYKVADDNWYNTRYNRKFIINGLIGKEWLLGRDVLSINLKASVMGGQRYTPVDETATLAHPDKEVQYDETKMFSEQFSPMFIGDFSIGYTLNRERVAHMFSLKSVNATRQREYQEHKYNIVSQKIEPFYKANSLLNISYRIDF